MDAYPIKLLLLVIYYGGIIIAASEGQPFQHDMVSDPAIAVTWGYVTSGLTFLGLPLFERSVLYFSSRMLLAASLLRIGAGTYFFYFFSIPTSVFRTYLYDPFQASKTNDFWILWAAIVTTISCSLFLRYLKRRQKRFLHLEE